MITERLVPDERANLSPTSAVGVLKYLSERTDAHHSKAMPPKNASTLDQNLTLI